MQPMFEALLALLKEPVRKDRGVRTDSSILLIYPPEKELDFREQLDDHLVPALDAQRIPVRLFDLSDFLFDNLDESDLEALQEDEFDDYSWMLQGLSSRVGAALDRTLDELAQDPSSSNVVIVSTMTLYPLVRFAELLRDRSIKSSP